MKIIKNTILAIAAFAATAASAGECQPCEYRYPYCNFGLDCLSNAIYQTKEDIYKKTGINFTYDYYADVYTNLSGGENHGTNYTHIMIFGAEIDFEKMFGVKGGSFVVSGAYNSGKDLSGKIGNFFTISQSAITGGWMFYEMYYQQEFNLPWEDVFTMRAGRLSMSSTFASMPIFGYLGSGSMDSTPEAIFYASPFTSSTIATLGFILDYETSHNLKFSYGLFQAPKNLGSSDWSGTDFGISGNEGYMMMYQVQWSPTFNNNLQGVYKLGGYYFDGYDIALLRNPTEFRDCGYGFYLQGQQMVWVDENAPYKNITLWAGTQYAPIEKMSPIVWQVFAGVQFSGFVPYRPNDSIFFSWTTGIFSDDYNNGNSSTETVFEANYLWQLNEHISIQPVVQYVMKPNGNSDIDNAFVLGGQIMVSF